MPAKSVPVKGGVTATARGNAAQAINEAFPPISPEIEPFGSRVLVQIRRPKDKVGSIYMTQNDKEAEKWNTQVAMVRALGPVAFHNRTTLTEWPESAWCKPGDYVRVPKYGGDRYEVPTASGEKALFVIFNDLDLLGKVTGDPLKIIAFV